MTTVRIPQAIQTYTQNQTVVTASGKNVRHLIDALERSYPGIKAALMDGDRLKPDVAVAVDGQLTRLGLLQPLTEENEVIFIPAIAGG